MSRRAILPCDGNKAVEKIKESGVKEPCLHFMISLIDGSLPMKKLLVKVHAEEDMGKDKTKLVAEMKVKAK